MNKFTITLCSTLVVSLLVAAAPQTALSQASDDFKVIVNSSNPITSMTSRDVSKMFLKKRSKWDNGAKVHPVDLPLDSPARETFSAAVHGKTAAKINSYWQAQVFSGRAGAPPVKNTQAEIVAFVMADPGAVGYVSSTTNVSGVKVIEVN